MSPTRNYKEPFFFSCKKETKEDTTQPIHRIIYPSSYLPAYPGSYWIYNNGDTIRCSDQYQVHALYSSWDWYQGQAGAVVSEYVLVPYYNQHYLYHYEYLNSECTPYSSATDKIMSELPGDSWTSGGDPHNYYSWTTYKILIKDTSVIINSLRFDSVIILQLGANNPYYPVTGYEYYAKNIGLIKKQQLNSTTINEYNYEIVSYLIKNH
jgi:hypothetical protein